MAPDEQARNRARSRELDDREQAARQREDELSDREAALLRREADLEQGRARLGEQAADLKANENELNERVRNFDAAVAEFPERKRRERAAARQKFEELEKPALVAVAKAEGSTAAEKVLIAAQLKAQQVLDEAATEAAAVKTNSRRPLGRDLYFLDKQRTRRDGTTFTLREIQAREEKTEFGLLDYTTESYIGDPKAGAHSRERARRRRAMEVVYAGAEQDFDAKAEALLAKLAKAAARTRERAAERDDHGLQLGR